MQDHQDRLDYFPLAPWHMWGTSEVMDLSGSAQEFQAHQLVRINYGRPDSWRFLFAVQLISDLVALDTLEIDFDVTLGVGRSSVALPIFSQFTFAGPVLGGTTLFKTKDSTPNAGEIVVAQDIQVTARMRGNFNPALTKSVTATAFFAPNVHIRPEWFEAQFRGEENAGT
jgi:hypothetical protein